MRLLNVHTFELAEFEGALIPPYVIASHRWTTDETTYKDVLQRHNSHTPGYQKVEKFCAFVRGNINEQIDWLWIDTCCIDKNNGSELSEAINSMFAWYARSQVCLSYLGDVRPLSYGHDEVLADFRRSTWFKRVWTLPELLAPSNVIFVTRDWEIIGEKRWSWKYGRELTSFVQEITGIPRSVLLNFEESKSLSIDKRLSWVTGRNTTLVEDKAYCLLGIFDVSLPIQYGEGEKAYARLTDLILSTQSRAGVSTPREDTPKRIESSTQLPSELEPLPLSAKPYQSGDPNREEIGKVQKSDTAQISKPETARPGTERPVFISPDGSYQQSGVLNYQRAIDIARSTEGPLDAEVSAYLEKAITDMWARIEAQPEEYTLTADEFPVFNFYLGRFEGNRVAERAVERYWASVSLRGPHIPGPNWGMT